MAETCNKYIKLGNDLFQYIYITLLNVTLCASQQLTALFIHYNNTLLLMSAYQNVLIGLLK